MRLRLRRRHKPAYLAMEYTSYSDFIDNPTAFDGKIPGEPEELMPPQVCLSQVYRIIIDLPGVLSYQAQGWRRERARSEKAMIAFRLLEGIGYQITEDADLPFYDTT